MQLIKECTHAITVCTLVDKKAEETAALKFTHSYSIGQKIKTTPGVQACCKELGIFTIQDNYDSALILVAQATHYKIGLSY